MADSRHKGKGSPQGSKATLQQVIVRIDRAKYRDLRSHLAKHGVTVSSFIREAVDKYLKEDE